MPFKGQGMACGTAFMAWHGMAWHVAKASTYIVPACALAAGLRSSWSRRFGATRSAAMAAASSHLSFRHGAGLAAGACACCFQEVALPHLSPAMPCTFSHTAEACLVLLHGAHEHSRATPLACPDMACHDMC